MAGYFKTNRNNPCFENVKCFKFWANGNHLIQPAKSRKSVFALQLGQLCLNLLTPR